MSCLLVLGLSALRASAWNVSGVVSCPNGGTAAGIVVSIAGVGSTTTDSNGAYLLELPDTAASYSICVDESTLPAGAAVSGCTDFSVDANNVFDCATGASLMLISADPANAADIAPVAISTGNLQIHTSACGK